MNSHPSPIFDYAGALERMGHDSQLFRDMVGFLAREGKQWMDELRVGVAGGNTSRVVLRAHSLKGLIANFGERRAWRAALKIEELAKAEQREQLEAAFPELEAAFTELLIALSPFLDPAVKPQLNCSLSVCLP